MERNLQLWWHTLLIIILVCCWIFFLTDSLLPSWSENQSLGVKSKEKRAWWAGVDKKIGTKMCHKLVDYESGKIVCRLVITSATVPGTANLHIDPIEPLPPDAIHSTEPDTMLDKLMTMADLKIPLSHFNEKRSSWFDSSKYQIKNLARDGKK